MTKEKVCAYCGETYTEYGNSGFPLVEDGQKICDKCSGINFKLRLGYKPTPMGGEGDEE